jgi:hypothetical protein
MSWAADPNNVLHMLALRMAEQTFADLIADGVGTREEFADLYLMYVQTRPGVGMGDVADELKIALKRWLRDRTFEQVRREMAQGRARELPGG